MKNTKKVIIASVILASAISFSSTLAWLVPIAELTLDNISLDGVTLGALYASGKGTEEEPYIIDRPRHLYNLAWLQYLGKYDDTQYYFEIDPSLEDDTLDMGEWTLPPIGTEDHPFIGSFNGNGKIISNLTVSNDYQDFSIHPSVVNNSNYTAPSVVGFFGVLGDIDNNISFDDYDSSANEFKNTGLANITINSETSSTLVGAAAGYSDIEISNVAVENPTINIVQNNATAYNPSLTQNISDHGIIGYTNKIGEISKLDKQIYGVNMQSNIEFNASMDGSTQGWGGSVDMYDMYTKLKNIWNGFNNSHHSLTGSTYPFQYPTNREITEEIDGTITVNSETGFTNNNITGNENGFFSSGGSNTRHYYGYKQYDNTDNKETASYSYVVEDVDNDGDYMQLTGKREVTIPNATTLKTNYYEDFRGSTVSITLNSVTYYLTNNGTNDVTATTNQANASLWEYSDNAIFTIINGTTYYLVNSGTNTVALSTNSSTTWNYDSTYGAYYYTNGNNTYYLNCTTSDWNLSQSTVDHVLLGNGNNYIAHPNTGSTVTLSTNTSDQSTWWYTSGTNFTTTNGGNIYLANSGGTTSATTPSFITGNNYRFASYTSGGSTYLRASTTQNNRYAFVRLNNNQWTTYVNRSVSANNCTPITITNVYVPGTNSRNIVFSTTVSVIPNGAKKSRTTTEDATFETYDTYFPLRQKSDAVGVPDETNTGYVVGGANYRDDPYGDIRVSKYSQSFYLSSSCYNRTNKKFTTVYTVNANNQREEVDANNFEKYDTAKLAMESVLASDTSSIYGLHFMDALVDYGEGKSVYAEKAVINGDTFYDYELPTDCIDFDLKEKGFINFFAGTYYKGNNSLFSLHEVERNGSNISNIKEIEGVYENINNPSQSYVYRFSDNTYSVPYVYSNGEKVNIDGTPYVPYSTQNSVPTGYTLAFSTSRIKINNIFSNNTNWAFYFEIPMNEGEYCLGSVASTGGTVAKGAYLMYLDIAANAAKTNRTVFYEHFIESKRTFEYPLGVALVKATTVSSANGVDSTDTANVVIYEGYQGELIITRDATLNSVTLFRESGMTANAKPTLIGDLMWDSSYQQYNLHDPGGVDNLTDEIVCEETIIETRCVQYYDFDLNQSSLMVTKITDTSTNGGAYVRTLYQQLANGTIYEDEDADQMRIFDSESGTRYSELEVRNQSIVQSYDTTLGVNDDLMLRLYFVVPNGVEVQFVLSLQTIIDHTYAPAQYYEFDGYLLEISLNQGEISIIVISCDQSVGEVIYEGSLISLSSSPIIVH